MAADKLKYAIGNSASTTLSVAMSNSDTSASLTSDTNFSAKTGEGLVIIDEGAATEELAYATGKSGSALTIPLANRGLEGGSAQPHSISATVKGVLSAGMWNDLIDSLENVLVKSSGAVDTTKIVTPTLAAKRGFYLPAQGMYAATTSGAASGQLETTTNKNNFKYFAFDQTSDEYVHFAIQLPEYYDGGTVTAKFNWTTESGGAAETVEWGIQGVAFQDDDTLDAAFGTAQTVSDTWTADQDRQLTDATSAVTIAGSPVAGDWVEFRIFRDTSEDDLGGDALLLGVRIEFGIDQYTDA